MAIGVFVRGSQQDAKVIAKRIASGQPSGGAELPDMCLIDLATLKDLVTATNDGVGLVVSARRVAGGAAVEIPGDFAATLASLNASRISEIAIQWAQSEEFRDLFEPETLESFLRDVVRLAASAVEEGASLLFVNI